MESFGTYLARQRELRGITSAEVAGETRLSPLAIHALENDRFDELPGRVFVVGYLRSYASCVGLCPDEVVARYDEYLGTQSPSEAGADEASKRRQGSAGGLHGSAKSGFGFTFGGKPVGPGLLIAGLVALLLALVGLVVLISWW